MKRILPYLQLALSMCIVGSSIIAGKLLANDLPIMLSSCLRFAIASPLLIIILLATEDIPRLPSLRDFLILIMQSIAGVFLFSIFLLYGLRHTSAIEAGLIMGLLPAITAICAWIILREKINFWQALGILFAASGAILLNTYSVSTTEAPSSTITGTILVFAAVICEALFAIFGKLTGGRISALLIATTISTLGFLLFLPFAIREASHLDFSSISSIDISLVVYFGIVVTAGAFWLFYTGLSKVQASVAGSFMAFIPLSAVLLSFFLLGEQIYMPHIIAGICVVVGILLSALSQQSNKPSVVSEFK